MCKEQVGASHDHFKIASGAQEGPKIPSGNRKLQHDDGPRALTHAQPYMNTSKARPRINCAATTSHKMPVIVASLHTSSLKQT